MKIGYFADGPWSHLALDRLADDSRFKIAFIVPRFDTRDPILAECAKRLGVDFLLLENVNSADSIDLLRQYGADLFVSMSYNQIFKTPSIALPPLGVINCHAGALPFYRGRNVLNWALINDADRFGVTVHYITDGGIDTGAIIVQEFFPISDADTYATLLDRAVEACGFALVDALDRIDRGTVQTIAQASVHSVGMYCGRRHPGDEWVDWNWPSRRIFNFVRAISPPGPCACTLLGTTEVRLLRAEMIDNAPSYIGNPGEVVGITSRGFVVKSGDSSILVTDATVADGGRLRIGARLGIDPLRSILEMRERIETLERLISDGRGA